MAIVDIALVLGVSSAGFLSGFWFRAWLAPRDEVWAEPVTRSRSQYEPPRPNRDF